MVSEASVLLRKIMPRVSVSDAERAALNALARDQRDTRAGEVLVREHRRIDHSTLLIDGFACRYKDMRDGRRQISALHVPGDFVDLHSFLLKTLDHDIVMLSPGRVASVPHALIAETIARFPRIERMFWLSTLVDAAIHREQILTIGRRSAVARIANLFLELQARLELVGLADGEEYRLPLTQLDLADATGLTSVHVNRMLRELRERGLADLRGGRVRILDRDGLAAVAEFDPTYLYLEHPGID